MRATNSAVAFIDERKDVRFVFLLKAGEDRIAGVLFARLLEVCLQTFHVRFWAGSEVYFLEYYYELCIKSH